MAATERGICTIQFGDDAEALVDALERRFPHAELIGDDPSFDAMVARRRRGGMANQPASPGDVLSSSVSSA